MEFTLTFLTHLRFNFTSMQQVQTLLFVGFKDGAKWFAALTVFGSLFPSILYCYTVADKYISRENKPD